MCRIKTTAIFKGLGRSNQISAMNEFEEIFLFYNKALACPDNKHLCSLRQLLDELHLDLMKAFRAKDLK